MIGPQVDQGPDWSRVWNRVGAVVLVAVLGVVFVAVSAMHHANARHRAVPVLADALQDPYTDVLERELRGGPPVVQVDQDLVFVDGVSREEAAAVGAASVASELAPARAAQLYDQGFPDPGRSPTHVGMSRRIVEQLTAAQHERVGVARLGAGVALGAALLFAVVTGLGSTGALFSVPGVGLLGAWLLSRAVLAVTRVALDRAHPFSDRFLAEAERAFGAAVQPLVFAGIALVVAGVLLDQVLRRFRVADGDVDEPASAVAAEAPTGRPRTDLARHRGAEVAAAD